jgi:transporter family-2 protein
MDRNLALVITLVVGGVVALQPPANAVLARHVSDLGAAFTSLAISTAIVGILLLSMGEVRDLGGLSAFRPEHAIGGVAGAAFVAVSVVTVRSLGAAGVTAVVVAMQLIVSATLDRLGVLGLERMPLTVTRVAGIALLIAGMLLVTSR